ncbi:methylenetetrahydrofolate reductase [NAD(P)H] [Gardnerella vaginalis]|uniref:Methylenetetrahydrofolate reductase n=1 Tax=Gardnerella vaginalis TaxID=2702 RepID=A0A2K1STR8_GARVA|nr:methylenetetrahydrofolate reductase [NAD(P)H] [Gardnerella vaginalis]PNS42944.1 methylenetetrahydrofolate reductase [NAD(P)H] [Gardnerella vaginalis]
MHYRPKFSLEVFPPKRTSPIGTIYDTLDGLKGLDPDFISVTYGTGKLKDRTATARIAYTIRSEYGIDAVAHLTARYLDYDAVDEALEMFDKAGVSGVLALRGDAVAGQEDAGVFEHASDLVSYIRSKRPDLPILGACYPEKHPEAKSLQEDIDNLKRKVDAGVTHLISQLFYDNQDFLRFRDLARASGIDVPIEAGVMPVANASQVKRMTTMCSSRITAPVYAMMDHWSDNADCLQDAGTIFASQQINDLVAEGVDGIHLYTMNRPGVARRIWSNVKPLFTKII